MGATASLTGTTEEETQVINDIRSVLETIAKNDAQSVDNSCVGFGTNDKDLIDLLCSRTKLQLEALDKEYRKEHEGKKLEDVIDSETSGDYRKFLKMMIQPRGLFLCQQLKKAMDGMGTDENRMNEIFCVISTEDMKAMKDTYEGLTGNRLLDTIRSELGGEHKELIAHLLMEGRDHSTVINQELAKEQAAKLIKIMENGAGMFGGMKDETKVKFSRKIAKISPYQLYAVQDEWDRAGQEMSLQATIAKKMGGDLEQATLYLLKRPEDFYAEKIKEACDGLGTDEEFLSFIVGGVDKHTALKVAERYYQKFNEDVIARMHSEVSGDYKSALIGWLKNEDPSKGQENELWQRAPGSMDFYKVACNIYENLKASPSANGHILTKKEGHASPEQLQQQQQQQMQQQMQMQQQQPQMMGGQGGMMMQQQPQMLGGQGGMMMQQQPQMMGGQGGMMMQQQPQMMGGQGGMMMQQQPQMMGGQGGMMMQQQPQMMGGQGGMMPMYGNQQGMHQHQQQQQGMPDIQGLMQQGMAMMGGMGSDSSDSDSDSSHGSANGKKERRRLRKMERRQKNGGKRKNGGKKGKKNKH